MEMHMPHLRLKLAQDERSIYALPSIKVQVRKNQDYRSKNVHMHWGCDVCHVCIIQIKYMYIATYIDVQTQ